MGIHASVFALSSYGGLHYFKAENTPQGAPQRCLDGCPHMLECPYHVAKIYLGSCTGWPVNVIATDLSMQGRIKALEEGPYGRCVFRCDNDVVDHQSVSLNFANGVTASFTMSGFTMAIHRNITLFGTKGEITGDMEDSKITVKDFSSRNIETIAVAAPADLHAGGDSGFTADFSRMVRGEGGLARNTVKDSFESHYMAFAAESSRLEDGRKVRLEEFRTR
jgi:predicted dehydrogenase